MLMEFGYVVTLLVDDRLEPFEDDIRAFLSFCVNYALDSGVEVIDEKYTSVIHMVDEAFKEVENEA